VGYTDKYLRKRDNIVAKFSDVFSTFVADPTEHEIRLVRGPGSSIYNLCHAYDRVFCKFLDHIDYSASLFINMDPNDLSKKILNFGSMNVGKFDKIDGIPSVLQHVINSLLFLDSKIDQLMFLSGLNKTELMGGETPSAELANMLLTVEGKVHKHYLARFLEQYSEHHRKVLRKLIVIANSEGKLHSYPEVKHRFRDYLLARNFEKDDLKLDDTSDLNDGLPSSWEVVCRKTDGAGITGTVPHVLRALQPYLASLPEEGFRYVLGRLVADAFGDHEVVDKILPGEDIKKPSAEADVQFAAVQVHLLTVMRSEFDKDMDYMEDIDPEITDASKFMTFPASRTNDQFIFINALIAKVQEAQERFSKREIGRTTLHIWLYNLISTMQGHVEILQTDNIRKNRTEARELIETFGQLFNMLRQVESQANADRAKKLDALQKKIAQQEENDPKRMEATAKIEMARARMAEVQLKYDTNNFNKLYKVQENRRAEEAHVADQRLKAKAYLTPVGNPQGMGTTKTQNSVGRPSNNDQVRGI